MLFKTFDLKVVVTSKEKRMVMTLVQVLVSILMLQKRNGKRTIECILISQKRFVVCIE